jgi:hypothetical protein
MFLLAQFDAMLMIPALVYWKYGAWRQMGSAISSAKK